jgi:hypothetical protein
MTSFFNYKGDAAGPTYEDYESLLGVKASEPCKYVGIAVQLDIFDLEFVLESFYG